MESDSDCDSELTPPIIREAANPTTLSLLPDTSKKKYNRAYNLFLEWKGDRNAKSFSENVLMAYFGDLAKKFKSSTLWNQYFMLRMTLSIHNNIDISKYLKLKAFLKRHSDNYRPKKSKIYTTNDINKFIKEAPDEIYLATKVALIMGIMGACSRQELHQMKITNFNDLGSAVLVTIPDPKTKIIRSFTVTSPYYEFYKKYANLRPFNVNGPWFFINYQKGKCTTQRIGVNKLGGMGKEIAEYLKLPNHELYTGHCFRRSSATILVDAGGDITTLNRNDGWKSTAVAEGYIVSACIDHTAQEDTHKTAGKLTQVYTNYEIRSKAIQKERHVVNQITSPLKSFSKSVSTSPIDIDTFIADKPSTSNIQRSKKIFGIVGESDSDISYTPSSPASTISLLDEVKGSPCLYELKSQYYRDQSVGHKAWEEISEVLHEPVEIVKGSCSKLRNAYLSAIKRRKTNSGQSARRIGQWKYEKEMSFLLPFMEMGRNNSHKPEANETLNQEEDAERLYDNNFGEFTENSPSSSSQNEPNRLCKFRKSVVPAHEMLEIKNLDTLQEERFKEEENQAYEYDEVEMFYMSMAQTVKKLSKVAQAQIRMQICQLLSKAEIEELKNGRINEQ